MLLAKILSLVLSNLKSLPRHVVHNQKSSLRRFGRDSLYSPWAALVSRNLFLFSKKVLGYLHVLNHPEAWPRTWVMESSFHGGRLRLLLFLVTLMKFVVLKKRENEVRGWFTLVLTCSSNLHTTAQRRPLLPWFLGVWRRPRVRTDGARESLGDELG